MNNTEEENRQLRAVLRQTQRDLAAANGRVEALEAELRTATRSLENSWSQLSILRQSSSWRLTAPIRVFKSKVAGVIK